MQRAPGDQLRQRGSSRSERLADDSGVGTRPLAWRAHRARFRRARSGLLLGGADEQLIDGDAAWAGDDVRDRVGDVVRLETLDVREPLLRLLEDLGSQMSGQLSGNGARFHE